MKNFILKKIKNLQKKQKKIENLLSNKKIISQKLDFNKLIKEYGKITRINNYFNEWLKIKNDIKNVKILLNDVEFFEIAKKELIILQKKYKFLKNKLEIFFIQKNSDNNRNCYIEIYAGTGGNEATIFVNDLFRMYTRYAETKNWKIEIININYSEYGGYKEIIIKILGLEAYGHFKFESGGHRVQRVPITESQGRIHTSTCTVAVFPEVLEHEMHEISSNDLRIDTFRSSGAGGQHVNTTDSAIRITHIPTNTIVECQDERSQHKNKAKAIAILKARIRAKEIEKKNLLKASTRRSLLGSGYRSDRNRTYNFPQGRVTDHRISLTIYQLNEILNGRLDLLIYPIMKKNQFNK